MKTTTYWFFLLFAATLFVSCEQDLKPNPDLVNDARLNFVYRYFDGSLIPAANVTDASRTASYSFISASVKKKKEIARDTLWFDVETMGGLSDKDRAVKLVQIPSDEQNAISGVHFVPFDDADFQKNCVIPAGKSQAKIPVVLLRDVSLQEQQAILKFAIGENENFKPGYNGLESRIIVMKDYLTKPAKWTGLGAYGRVKHRLLIDWTGQPWDDAFMANLLKDQGYFRYMQSFAITKLKEENSKRTAAGLPKYQEADGTVVSFF